MAKNSEWFAGIFKAATAAIPENTKNLHYNVMYKAIMDCVRGGENDQSYVRNQLGYDSDNMPTQVRKDSKEFYVRSELFNVIWNKVLTDIRIKVADATANTIWGFSFAGMRGINGLIGPYCSAIERGMDQVTFVAAKKDVKALSERIAPSKKSKAGQVTFSLPISEFVELLDRKFPGHKIAATMEKEEDGVKVKSSTHDLFAATYRAKLGKYAEFRQQRLSVGVADIADGYEW